MSSLPPPQPDPTGPPGSAPTWQAPAAAPIPTSTAPTAAPTGPPTVTFEELETALWPADLPKEPSGWGTLGKAFLSILLFCVPLGVLTAIGHIVGPPIEHIEANNPITIKGDTHELVFDLPWACDQDLSDQHTPTFTCTQDDHEVQVAVNPADTINDLELAAKRGAREATFNRFALDFPSQLKDINDGKAAHVIGGEGFLGINADALTLSPNADASGFVIKITDTPDDGAESDVPAFSEHLLKSASFKKIEEGK